MNYDTLLQHCKEIGLKGKEATDFIKEVFKKHAAREKEKGERRNFSERKSS